MTEIEQLRADIATLEAAENLFARKYGQTYIRYNIELEKLRNQLAKLEEEAADPWHEAKYLVAIYHDCFDGHKRVVAKYARHLEAHVAELEQKLAKRPVVWCVRSNISGNFYRLYDEPAVFATANQARKCPGVPKEWIVESYTGE